MENNLLVEGQAEFPEVFIISNAGLCLLSPWFPRLFNILGYLDKDHRSFKDMASKIRAVFLLQYLVNSDEKVYRETELTFNRLLISLPMHIPLPECLMLTEREKDIADDMMKSVKANWEDLRSTSVRGLQQNFIARTGRLEQQEEKWQLIVDQRTLDILLRHVPWGFKQIRYPWLKKYIQVNWYE